MKFKIEIKGDIGWEVLPQDVANALKEANGRDILVEINSPGGSIYDGIEIFNLLYSYEGDVEVVIVGTAMSMASYIALAGNSIKAYDNAIYMIHNGWVLAMGDHLELRKVADHLEALSNMLAKKYIEASSQSEAQIKAWMDDTTYFYGAEIVNNGFAKELITTETDNDKAEALALATEAFKACEQKIRPNIKTDLEKAVAIMPKNSLMKQCENKTNFKKPKGESMTEEEKAKLEAEKAQARAERDEELAKQKAEIEKMRAEKAEADRQLEIHALQRKYSASDDLYAKFEKEGTPNAFMEAILDEQKVSALKRAEGGDIPEKEQMIQAMSDGLAMRCGVEVPNAHKDAKMFQSASLLAVGRKMSGASEYASPVETANKVLAMGTGDFPILLSNVANKVLEEAWEKEPTTYQSWTGSKMVNDFKEQTFINVGGFGLYKDIYEKGEFRSDKLKESKETGKVGSKGLVVTLSREAIINDDLGGFMDTIRNLTEAGKRTLNTDVYSVLTDGNYKMSDGKAIFHNDHNNKASAGTAITVAALTAGELAMSNQKGLNGEALNLAPYFLICGSAKYREALQVLGSTSMDGNNSGVINTWRGQLEVIKDSNIPSNQWYLASRSNTVRTLFLNGAGDRPIIEQSDKSLFGLEYVAVFDYGVMVANYRTLYQNLGA